MPEQQALDILLRSLSGYVAAPRAAAAAGVSRFDRIVVMPAVAPPVSRTASNPPPVFQQTNNPTVMQVPQQPAQAGLQPFQPLGDDQEDDRPAAPAAVAAPVTPFTPGGNRGPVFNVFPQPQIANPQAPGPSGPVVSPAQGPLVLPPPNPPASAPPAAYPGAPTAPPGVSVPGMVAPTPQQQGRPGQPAQTPQ